MKTIVDLRIASSCWRKIWKLKRIILLKTYTFFLCITLLTINYNHILISKWVFLLLLLIHVIYFWIFLDRDEIDVIKSFKFLKKIKNKLS